MEAGYPRCCLTSSVSHRLSRWTSWTSRSCWRESCPHHKSSEAAVDVDDDLVEVEMYDVQLEMLLLLRLLDRVVAFDATMASVSLRTNWNDDDGLQ